MKAFNKVVLVPVVRDCVYLLSWEDISGQSFKKALYKAEARLVLIGPIFNFAEWAADAML